MNTINVNGMILSTELLDENSLNNIELAIALQTDLNRPEHSTSGKWLGPNFPLFANSKKYPDMFLTYYRFRNAHESLIHKLKENETVTEAKDMALVIRLFDMAFYPLKSLSLKQHSMNMDPRVYVTTDYKAKNEKNKPKRPYEITTVLSDGTIFQLDINQIVSRFLDVKANFESIISSEL